MVRFVICSGYLVRTACCFIYWLFVIGCEYRESDLADTVIVVHEKKGRRGVFVEFLFFTDHLEMSMVCFLAASNIWRKKI